MRRIWSPSHAFQIYKKKQSNGWYDWSSVSKWCWCHWSYPDEHITSSQYRLSGLQIHKQQSEDICVPMWNAVQTYLGHRRWRSVRTVTPLGQIRMYPWHVIIIGNIVKNKAVLSWCFLRDYHKSSQQVYQVVFIMKISLLEFACVTVLWLCCYSWNSGQMWGQFSRMIGKVMIWLKINPVFLGS